MIIANSIFLVQLPSGYISMGLPVKSTEGHILHTHDLAILQFPDGNKYESLILDTDEDELKRGQPVITMGSPLGFQGTIAYGNISAFPKLEKYGEVRCIQYTAPISHGSSGGCLFNDKGKVIGITTAISEEGQNIAIAVPAQYLLRLYYSWDGSFEDMSSHHKTNENRESVDSEKYRVDHTQITGGVINKIVEVPNGLDVTNYPMKMLLSDFLNQYEGARSNRFKAASSVRNPRIEDKQFVHDSIDIGFRISLSGEKKDNLDIPIDFIVFYDLTDQGANARACLSVFCDDLHLLDKLIDFYNKNCYKNGTGAALLTSDGYFIRYNENMFGKGLFICNVIPY